MPWSSRRRIRHVRESRPACCPSLAGSTKRSRSRSGRLRSIRYAARVHFNLATYLTALGRYDEAEAALRKAIALQPQSAQNYMWLAIIQILRGKPGAAVELAKQETDPFWRTYALALAYFAHGDRAEADAELKKLIDEDADDAGSQIAAGLCPAQRAGEDVRVAGARLEPRTTAV